MHDDAEPSPPTTQTVSPFVTSIASIPDNRFRVNTVVKSSQIPTRSYQSPPMQLIGARADPYSSQVKRRKYSYEQATKAFCL